MDKLAPVDLSTLHERVYSRLREAILQGDFVPGEVLTIRTLAASLGTSSMPVREALRRLVAEKALVQQANRSIAVSPFNLVTFGELIRIRMAIESMATRYATQRTTPDLLQRLTELNTRMKAAVEAKDVEALLDSNKTFHFTIYAAADMPQLFEIIQGMWLRTGPYLRAAYRSVPGAERHFMDGTRVHARVIAAMEAGNARRAGAKIALDIGFTARRFGPVIAQLYSATEETLQHTVA